MWYRSKEINIQQFNQTINDYLDNNFLLLKELEKKLWISTTTIHKIRARWIVSIKTLKKFKDIWMQINFIK